MLLRLLLLTVLFQYSFFCAAQADGCSLATSISVTANCSSPTNGTTIGATETIPGCSGNADDDVWYSFVATATAHQIVVVPSGGMDAVVQLFSGPCSTLNSLVCRNNGFTGSTETINATGLSVGVVYRIRVYHAGAGSGSGTFSICVTNAPPVPANNECGNATSLTVNAGCILTNSTTIGATQSLNGCSGNADDDVWFSFVATNSVQTVTVNPLDNLDLVFQVYSGACNGLNSIVCVDNSFTGQSETNQLVGLTVGQTYFVRVYDYYAGTNGNFSICVTGTPTAIPSNNEPCAAITIPNVTSACQYLEFTNVSATSTVAAPTPSACVGGGGPAMGGFSGTTADVWFAITVPASGNVLITSKPNMGGGSISDGVMALYSGTCGALTQISCSDDHNYPGTGNDLLPMLSATGLTPGAIVFLRYWGFGSNQGTFGFCVSTATNDDCANALYICDINGYSASTSAAYTADRPDNMHGNNETQAGVNLADGIDSGGPFGSAGPWGTGSPLIDVNIENNSWIKFTAAATTATLTVNIYDCWVGNYPSGGIQMQIFSATDCTNFVPVSNFEESSTGFVITGNNLIVGNDYYLMVDGYAGDICNYTIAAESGVQFPDIADVAPICLGESVILTAPAGATSYEWQHDGSTTQSVTVAPGTTQTYYCEVSGLCDFKQMLDVEVQVNPFPIITINGNNPVEICNGDATNLTASGATSYLWSTGQTNATISVSPTSSTVYTVSGTSNGCTTNEQITVTVNPIPTVSITTADPTTICNGESVTLNANGATNYIWSTGETTNSISVSPSSNTTYNVTGSSLGCDDVDQISIIVNAVPNVEVNGGNSIFICEGESVNLDATGATSYVWNTSETTSTISVSPVVTTNFSVVGTTNGCSDNDVFTVTVNPNPSISGTAVTSNADCGASNGSISGIIANGTNPISFSWTNIGNTEVGTNLNLSNQPAGTYNLTVIDGNNCEATFGPYSIINPGAPDAPNISINNQTPCETTSADFSTPAIGGATYSWTGPNGFTSNAQSFSINDLTSVNTGAYCLTITVLGCESAPTCESMIVNSLPNIDINAFNSDSTICEGGNATLTASGGNSYSWSGPNGFISLAPTAIIDPFGLINEGYYYLIGVDGNSCLNQDSIFLSVVPLPTIAISDSGSGNHYCLNATIGATATGGDSYFWSGPENFSSVGASFQITDAESENEGWYVVIGTDNENCSNTDSIYLDIITDLTGGAASSDSIVCPGEDVQFSATGGGTYLWTGQQNLSTTEANFVLYGATASNSGWYYVQITDTNGCIFNDSTYLSVEPKASCLTIPDLATPDGNGDNETWEIIGIEQFQNSEVEIYNRWGNLIYTASPYLNDWGGQVNHGSTIGSSGKVPVGTYFYILKLNDEAETPPFKGYIEIQY